MVRCRDHEPPRREVRCERHRLFGVTGEAVAEHNERILAGRRCHGRVLVRIRAVQHPIGRGDLRLQFGRQHPGDIDRLLRVTRRAPGCAGYHTTTLRPPARCSRVNPTAYGPGFAYGAGFGATVVGGGLDTPDDDEQLHATTDKATTRAAAQTRAESRHSGESASAPLVGSAGDRKTSQRYARIPQSSSRQHALGPLQRPRRRHRGHHRVQSRHDVDAAHSCRPRVGLEPNAARSARSRRGSTRGSWDRSSR